MIQNKLALMAIPVLAAVLIGGTILPAAYAGITPSEQRCDDKFDAILDALNDDNIRQAVGLIKAYTANCLDDVDQRCVALWVAFLQNVILNDNVTGHVALLNALETTECKGGSD